MKVTYTWRERKIKQRTKHDIFNAARLVLEHRGVKFVCTDAIHRFSDDEMFTIERGNELIEQVVTDSLFYR